jgi:hypothetical protein
MLLWFAAAAALLLLLQVSLDGGALDLVLQGPSMQQQADIRTYVNCVIHCCCCVAAAAGVAR